MTSVKRVIFIKHSFTHACTNITQTVSHTNTHTILVFTGLDFGCSQSLAAFISVGLDTIYYQLFFLVSPSWSVSLSSYVSGCGLTAAEFSDSVGVRVLWL